MSHHSVHLKFVILVIAVCLLIHNSPPLREIDLDDDDDATTLPEPTNLPSRDLSSSALNHLSHGNSPRDSNEGGSGAQASEKGLPGENKVSGDTTHDHSHPPDSGVTHPKPPTPIVNDCPRLSIVKR